MLRVRSRSNDPGPPTLGPIVEGSSSTSPPAPRPSGPREPGSPRGSNPPARSPVDEQDDGEDSPAHLFWVPAHLHPELAPGEFRAFLKAHTHADPLGEGSTVAGLNAQGAIGSDPDSVIASDGGAGVARTPSWLARRGSLGRGTSSLSPSSSSSGAGGSGGLGRKRSMLSRQYHPRPGDNVEDEQPPVPSLDLHRSSSSSSSSSAGRPTSIYGGLHGDEGVTLADLQKLEQLADEASDDPAKMRSLLRRTLSTKVLPDMEEDRAIGYNVDENDVPILVPPPGQILRRTARTKIRKVGLAGDGGGHRFGPSRKGRTAIRTEEPEHEVVPPPQQAIGDESAFGRRRPSDGALASDDDEMYSAESGHSRERYDEQPVSRSYLEQRRPSDGSTEESAIYDSYADTSVESSVSSVDFSTTDESSSTDPSQQHIEHREEPASDQYIDWDHERTPTSTHSNDAARNLILGRTPVAAASPPSSPETIRKGELYAPVAPSAPAPPPKKEKEKKGGFFSKSKDKKADVKSASTKKEKEKDGFLGGLFSSKKKVEEPAPGPSKFSEAGRQTAAALLGSSKSAKSLGLAPMGVSPTSPGFSPYARYPIHVERAVYRLSHIKLANPRRPLYEQVLISNLMFWYLSVINRAQTGGGSGTSPGPTQTEDKNKPKAQADEDDEDESRGASGNQKVGGGTPPRPAEEYKPKNARPPQPAPVRQQAPEPAPPPPPQAKRNPLSKPERARGSEQVVRPPQYGMQNLQIEKEYRQPQNRGPPPPQQAPPPIQQMQPPSSPRRQPSPQPAAPSTRTSAPVREPVPFTAPAPPQSYAPPPQMYPNYNARQPEPPQQAPRAPPPSVRPPPIQTQPAPRPLPQHEPQHPPVSPRSQRAPQSPSKSSGFSHDSGPRPGEVFQWPVSAGSRPGQPYPSPSHGPQPGQVFVHPQYTNNGPYPAPQQGRPPPQQEMRLPPGAAPPRHVAPPAGAPGWVQAPPPHQYQQQQQQQQQMHGRPTVDQGRRATSGPAPVDPYASDVYAPQHYGNRSVSAGPPANGAYNPYMRQQSPPNGDRRYEDPHYRQQPPAQQPYPVPNGQYYGDRR